MTDDAASTKLSGSSRVLGVWAFVLAVLAALSVAMIGVTSFTSFNPPGWVRIASMAPLPLVMLASIGCAILGIGKDATRGYSIASLVLDGASVVAFGLMISVGG